MKDNFRKYLFWHAVQNPLVYLGLELLFKYFSKIFSTVVKAVNFRTFFCEYLLFCEYLPFSLTNMYYFHS